jgi:drug/metabolite transporter (DMT)-like permease
VWSVLLAWALLGERPSGASLLRLALALAGVAIVLQTPGGDWPLPRSLADALGLLGGFSFAFTNIMLRKLHDVPAASRVLAMFGGGTVLAAAAAVAGVMHGGVAAVPALPPAALWVGLALALAMLAANLCLQYGASRLPAHTTALIMLSEVLFASASAAWLGAGAITPRVLAGAVLILFAAAWSAWPARAGAK